MCADQDPPVSRVWKQLLKSYTVLRCWISYTEMKVWLEINCVPVKPSIVNKVKGRNFSLGSCDSLCVFSCHWTIFVGNAIRCISLKHSSYFPQFTCAWIVHVPPWNARSSGIPRNLSKTGGKYLLSTALRVVKAHPSSCKVGVVSLYNYSATKVTSCLQISLLSPPTCSLLSFLIQIYCFRE